MSEYRNPEDWHPDPDIAWGGEAKTYFLDKINNGPVSRPSSRATLVAPIPPATLGKWRAVDPRPSNTTYFDGVPYPYMRPLPTKAKRGGRKAVAV